MLFTLVFYFSNFTTMNIPYGLRNIMFMLVCISYDFIIKMSFFTFYYLDIMYTHQTYVVCQTFSKLNTFFYVQLD